MPFKYEDKTLYVAMADPLDIDTIEQIKFITNCQIKPAVTTFGKLQDALRNVIDGFALTDSPLQKFIEKYARPVTGATAVPTGPSEPTQRDLEEDSSLKLISNAEDSEDADEMNEMDSMTDFDALTNDEMDVNFDMEASEDSSVSLMSEEEIFAAIENSRFRIDPLDEDLDGDPMAKTLDQDIDSDLQGESEEGL